MVIIDQLIAEHYSYLNAHRMSGQIIKSLLRRILHKRAFLYFNIDPAFNNCLDGLVIDHTHRIKPQKRRRYMEETIFVS